MTDRPIIFSAPMVRALLDGRKTMTRRIIKPQPMPAGEGLWHFRNRWGGISQAHEEALTSYIVDAAARFASGDRLWVRENWAPLAYSRELGGSRACKIGEADFAMMIDGHHQHKNGRSQPGLKEYAPGAFDGVKWAPSIHMPRWASRLTLLVTGVKVERLQDISREDAIAEGIVPLGRRQGFDVYTHDNANGRHGSPISTFADLWRTINGEDAWDKNPWVVAVSFTVHKTNIDQMQEAA